jgi:pyruvate formate lyase activating enzyme
MMNFKEILNSNTKESEFYTKLGNNQVKCYACGHRCRIPVGREGVCKVRFNKEGKLFSPYNYISGLHPDPIEKKPFYHVHPGSITLSFGMLGCDFKCSFCQNWNISQVIRDEEALSDFQEITAPEIIEIAKRYKSRIITSTYNEPLITSEWALGIFSEAKQYGIHGAFVSNGNATPEVLDKLRPYVDFFKVDLKNFDEKKYQKLGGRLKVVLDSIQDLYYRKFWVEIVTLVIPDYNDSEKELSQIAGFIASISKDIPWHVTAFHKDYKMYDKRNTNVSHLLKAVQIGLKAGLKYVYAGNIPGQVKNYENTYCPECSVLLIDRIGYRINQKNLIENKCPKCGYIIAGIWN